MRIPIVVLVLLAVFGMQSFGQQRPELAGTKQAPGQQTDADTCQAEVKRLQQLIADQHTYIGLLEQKLQSLAPQPATEKGKTP